jgi:mannose-6-phosphate isomerase-like protein (cupin superfamily)
MNLPDSPLDLAQKLASFSEHWTPHVLAELNDYQVKLAKLKGEFVWHSHADTDELFLVLEGALTLDLPGRSVTLKKGQMYVVPKGIDHRPHADEECHLLLVEPRGVVNTGEEGGELTAANDRWIEGEQPRES